MTTLGIKWTTLKGDFASWKSQSTKQVGRAATSAMHELGDKVKGEARAQIAAAGFSKRWQNALRVNVYPDRSKASLTPAAYMYHRIKYSEIYEEGGILRGKPYMWLPLPTVPFKLGRERMTPKLYASRIGKLESIRGAAKPLLGARLTVTPSMMNRKKSFTLSQLRKGHTKAGVGAGLGVIRVVPMFVGIPMVSVRKRLSLKDIARNSVTKYQNLFDSRMIK